YYCISQLLLSRDRAVRRATRCCTSFVNSGNPTSSRHVWVPAFAGTGGIAVDFKSAENSITGRQRPERPGAQGATPCRKRWGRALPPLPATRIPALRWRIRTLREGDTDETAHAHRGPVGRTVHHRQRQRHRGRGEAQAGSPREGGQA